MNIFDFCQSVLIIGNGFDRNCGLKTSYQDVYEAYFNSTSKNSLIEKFKKDIKHDFKNWADFELQMSEYAKEFDSEDDFIECLDDFVSFMHIYLFNVQIAFINEWNSIKTHKSTIDSFIGSISSLGQGITHNIDSIVRTNRATEISNIGFISLNYTETLDNLLEFSYDERMLHKVLHVHGLLGDDPILGMDREEQLDVSYDISDRFRRHFIKPFFNKEYDVQRVIDAENLINNANFVFVYGASLDESDLSWRELLIRWLCSNENHHLFLYIHKNESVNTTSKPYVLDCERDEKARIINKWRLETEDIPFERLHIPCGIKLFNIETAITNDKLIKKK